MAACERCWAEYRRREFVDGASYHQVLVEREAAHGGCTPEEECGEMHLIIGGSCRCGKRHPALVYFYSSPSPEEK